MLSLKTCNPLCKSPSFGMENTGRFLVEYDNASCRELLCDTISIIRENVIQRNYFKMLIMMCSWTIGFVSGHGKSKFVSL